jgi:hypothetical protein
VRSHNNLGSLFLRCSFPVLYEDSHFLNLSHRLCSRFIALFWLIVLTFQMLIFTISWLVWRQTKRRQKAPVPVHSRLRVSAVLDQSGGGGEQSGYQYQAVWTDEIRVAMYAACAATVYCFFRQLLQFSSSEQEKTGNS